MARRAGARDVAPKIRAAFKRAVLHWAGERGEVYEYLALYGANPDELSDTEALELLWLHLLRADPKDALATFARFVPRELLLEQVDDEKGEPVLSGEPLTESEWHERYGGEPTAH